MVRSKIILEHFKSSYNKNSVIKFGRDSSSKNIRESIIKFTKTSSFQLPSISSVALKKPSLDEITNRTFLMENILSNTKKSDLTVSKHLKYKKPSLTEHESKLESLKECSIENEKSDLAENSQFLDQNSVPFEKEDIGFDSLPRKKKKSKKHDKFREIKKIKTPPNVPEHNDRSHKKKSNKKSKKLSKIGFNPINKKEIRKKQRVSKLVAQARLFAFKKHGYESDTNQKTKKKKSKTILQRKYVLKKKKVAPQRPRKQQMTVSTHNYELVSMDEYGKSLVLKFRKTHTTDRSNNTHENNDVIPDENSLEKTSDDSTIVSYNPIEYEQIYENVQQILEIVLNKTFENALETINIESDSGSELEAIDLTNDNNVDCTIAEEIDTISLSENSSDLEIDETEYQESCSNSIINDSLVNVLKNTSATHKEVIDWLTRPTKKKKKRVYSDCALYHIFDEQGQDRSTLIVEYLK